MGLAVGDDSSGVARALEVVAYRGTESAAALIVAQAERLGAAVVVIGLPLDADGAHTPACRRSEVLAAAVAARGLAVELQGEYLTSDEARRRARAAGLPATTAVDHLAAQVILEDFFTARASQRRGR